MKKTFLGMAVFSVPIFILYFIGADRIELGAMLSVIQATLTLGIFILVSNFYKEWKESKSQNEKEKDLWKNEGNYYQ